LVYDQNRLCAVVTAHGSTFKQTKPVVQAEAFDASFRVVRKTAAMPDAHEHGGVAMKHKLISASALLLIAYFAFHSRIGISKIESSSLMIAEQAGLYIDSSRYDPEAGAMRYWVDATEGALRKSLPDGALQEDIAASLDIPYGLAFDLGSQSLLWTSAGGETVQTVPVGGGKPVALITQFEEPYAIDVSTESERAYYTATGSVIYRNAVNLQSGEESSEELLVLPETEQVHGLALDPATMTLYVGDINGRMTRKIDLNKNIAERLIHTESEPYPPPYTDPEPVPAELAVETHPHAAASTE
jgi:DNA-binding beta-propeller fold protein YncE